MIYKLFGGICIAVSILVGMFSLKSLFGFIASLISSPNIDSYLFGGLTFSLLLVILSGLLAIFLFKFGKRMFYGY